MRQCYVVRGLLEWLFFYFQVRFSLDILNTNSSFQPALEERPCFPPCGAKHEAEDQAMEADQVD
jgi:hypothetical protein